MEIWQIFAIILSYVLGYGTCHFVSKRKYNINSGNGIKSMQDINAGGNVVQGDMNVNNSEVKKEKTITFKDGIKTYSLNISFMKSIETEFFKSVTWVINFYINADEYYIFGKDYKINREDIEKIYSIINDFRISDKFLLDLDEVIESKFTNIQKRR